jgi:hypothetical protein
MMYTWNWIQDFHDKSSIPQEEHFFHQQIGLKFEEETSKCSIRSIAFDGAETRPLWNIDQK